MNDEMIATLLALESYGDGWQWTTELNDHGRILRSQARTNESGNGLWIGGRQVEGHAQFSLPRAYDQARAAIISNVQRAGYTVQERSR